MCAPQDEDKRAGNGKQRDALQSGLSHIRRPVKDTMKNYTLLHRV